MEAGVGVTSAQVNPMRNSSFRPDFGSLALRSKMAKLAIWFKVMSFPLLATRHLDFGNQPKPTTFGKPDGLTRDGAISLSFPIEVQPPAESRRGSFITGSDGQGRGLLRNADGF